MLSGGLGHAFAHHLLAPRPRRLRFVEAHRGHRREGERVTGWWQRAALGPAARLAEEMTIDRRLVAFIARGRKAALVTRMGIDGEVELEHLPDAPRLGLVGLLRVEIQQEPSQAVPAPALGRDVLVHPAPGVAHRRERTTSLDLLVVVEADRVGLAATLGDIRPRRLFRPWSGHLAPLFPGSRSLVGPRRASAISPPG
jgi:hypothetical protein